MSKHRLAGVYCLWVLALENGNSARSLKSPVVGEERMGLGH